MPPISDTRLLAPFESMVIFIAVILLLLLTGILLCTCCDDKDAQNHGENVVEQPPNTKAISEADETEGDPRRRRKKKRKNIWEDIEQKQARRPIMPVTANLMVKPENQKYVSSWSVNSKTDSQTASVASDMVDRQRSRKSRSTDGIKVVYEYKIGSPRKPAKEATRKE